MDKNEKRICWYSSVLISMVVNSPKLLAMRPNGIIAHYWHFNLAELLFQVLVNLAFYYVYFYYNLSSTSVVSIFRLQRKLLAYVVLNTLFVLFVSIFFGSLQKFLFGGAQSYGLYLLGYFTRLGLGSIFIGVLIKIMLLMREGKARELENERLQSANIRAELELLKSQVNPHFLFNALSSLSGLVTENPVNAQHYIRQLANIFRYSFGRQVNDLVTVKEELAMMESFAQLLKMRMENAIKITMGVNNNYLDHKLPHLSLQPLLENAAKHNAATTERPLKVNVYIEDDQLVLANSLWEIPSPETSNGLGLTNLNERYRILMNREIIIDKNETAFTVKLPLIA